MGISRPYNGVAIITAVATGVLGAGLTLAACGNDFDGLFPADPSALEGGPGPTTTSSSGTTGGTSGSNGGTSGNNPNPDDGGSSGAPNDGGPPSDAKVDAPLKCGAPAATCLPPVTTEQGGNITGTCTGCGCTCPNFPCTQGGNPDNCTTNCLAGAICNSTCDVDDDCRMIANNATFAKMLCTGNDLNDCRIDCQGNSTCELDCQVDRNCTAVCAATSSCMVRCGPDVNNCNVDCPGGTKKTCPNNVFVCNRDCPL